MNILCMYALPYWTQHSIPAQNIHRARQAVLDQDTYTHDRHKVKMMRGVRAQQTLGGLDDVHRMCITRKQV